MNPAFEAHPRFPDYWSALEVAERLQRVYPGLRVNIHPFGFVQSDGARYQLSLSD